MRGFDDPHAITLDTARSVFYQPDDLNPKGYTLPFHLMGPTWPNRMYWMTGMIDPEGTGGGPIFRNVAPPKRVHVDHLRRAPGESRHCRSTRKRWCALLKDSLSTTRETIPPAIRYLSRVAILNFLHMVRRAGLERMSGGRHIPY